MNSSLSQQINDILGKTTPEAQLTYEAPLLVAARMLGRAAPHEMTATTVVGVVGREDHEAFCALVQDIVDEYGLAATISLKFGSFSVRFERLAPESDDASSGV